MNDFEGITFSTNTPIESNVDKICRFFEEIGWQFDRQDNKIQVAFSTSEECRIPEIVCIMDVQKDKLLINTALGIKSVDPAETLELINYINTNKIYYGRFVMLGSKSIWYDYAVDIMYSGITKDICFKAISIADACVNRFCNTILDVATGHYTASEAIKAIK